MTSSIVPDMLASPEDYAQIPGAPQPKDPDALPSYLAACTDLVLTATVTAVYDTDPSTGLAVDAAVRQALADATCIQTAAWISLGLDPFTGGVATATTATSKKIGTATIEYAGAAAASVARAAAAATLVPLAVRRLQRAGLLSNHVRVV